MGPLLGAILLAVVAGTTHATPQTQAFSSTMRQLQQSGPSPPYAPGYLNSTQCSALYNATRSSSATGTGSVALGFNVVSTTSLTITLLGINVMMVVPSTVAVYYRVRTDPAPT